MIQSKEDILRHQLGTPYHQNTPLGKERAHYLFHLLAEGWSAFTVMGKSCELSAFARRVDIAGSGKISAEQIEAAAKYCISHRAHPSIFSRSIGRHKARCRFVRAVTDWLRFVGRFKEEPQDAAYLYPHADLVKEFLEFLARERGPDALLVPDDPAMVNLMDRLGVAWERRNAVFSPVGSAHRHEH